MSVGEPQTPGSSGRAALAERFKRLEPLLDRALDLEGAERENFLKVVRDIHPELYPDLLHALGAGPESLPALGALAAEVTAGPPTDRRGLRAGPWQLLEKLGRGGMGTVYRARRADGAFDKQVAVKLLRHGDSRFRQQLERERQLLARLEHPAIARLLDGGVLPDGQPYLVMELAEGEDLDQWLRNRKPDLRTRIEVMLKICAAVSEAHAQLIVHRDLKPSNVRVTAEGQVKLLDFGIAKLLDAESAEASARGETRALALTPEFAAPEQLRGQPVGTRSDVYALGALLFHLLTGRSPHPGFDGDWATFIQRVCNEDAPAPSRVGTELPRSTLRGDLDAIVGRALMREPARRYASAEALADDLRRYLDGRPVRARAGRRGYRLRKWLQRHRIATSLAALLLLAVSVGIAGVLWQAHSAAEQRDLARLEARRYLAVMEYLGQLFADAAAGAGDADQLRARELLAAAPEQILEAFVKDPATGRVVLATIGELHIQLQDFAKAEPLLRAVLALDGADIEPALHAQVLSDLALVEVRQGRPREACAQVDQGLEVIAGLEFDARAQRAQLLAVRGQCLRLLGDPSASLAAYEEAARLRRTLGEHAPEAAVAASDLGTAYYMAGRLDEARTSYEQAARGFEAQPGGQPQHLANVLNNLASLAMMQGRLDEAERHFERALDLHRERLGDSAALGALAGNLGKLSLLRGRIDEAQALLRESLQLQQRFVGAESPDAAFSHLGLADLALATDVPAQALAETAAALAIFRNRLGPEHLFVRRAELIEAQALAQAQRSQEAAERFEEALQALAALPGAQAQRMRGLGACARLLEGLSGRLPAAASIWVDACRAHAQTQPPGHYERIEAELLLQIAEGADPTALQTQLEALRQQLGEASPRLRALRDARSRQAGDA
jgi:eukaryotic-like serine/threonine-protein kinase